MSNTQPVLLVTGAAGHLGRRVIELLLEANAGTIIAATRSPEKLADFKERGVIVRYANFDEPDSLAQAFAGVDRLLLISTDTLDKPGHRLEQHLAAVKAADAAGVSHVIYTSLVNPEPDSPVFLAPDHYGTETALTNSKMGWTILRNNIYTEMLISTLARAIQMGGLYNACGDGKTGYVTREDCAQAAAAALASSFTGRRVLNVTGPESLSQADLAAIASELSGRQIAYVPLKLDVMIENMVAAGLPPPLAAGFASFDTATAQGRCDVVSNVVEELSGKKPIRVADFLAAHRSELLEQTAVS